MKKLLIGLLLVSASASAGYRDLVVNPKGPSDYVDTDRFISTYMPDPLDYIITDTKTGCQYFMGASYRTVVLLGCFDEYKR